MSPLNDALDPFVVGLRFVASLVMVMWSGLDSVVEIVFLCSPWYVPYVAC